MKEIMENWSGYVTEIAIEPKTAPMTWAQRPYFENTEAIVSMTDDELIHPDKEDSTELGEVPQAAEQGSIRPGFIRDPYALNYLYTI